MKNVFKKAIRFLDKQDVVIVSRSGDYYGICGPYFALLVPAGMYDCYFRTEKPYYVPLEDHQTWKSYKHDRKTKTGDLSPEYMDIDKLFPADATITKITPYQIDVKGVATRIFAGNDLIVVNSEYADAFMDIFGSEYIYSSGRIKPLLWQDGMQPVVSGVLLPVNAHLPEEVHDAILNIYKEA